MKKILYTQLDGTVAIVTPTAKAIIEELIGPMTKAEYEAHVYEVSVPADATNVREIDDTDIPTSREFREAWSDIAVGTQIDIDCDKAKEIALTKLRTRRNNKLLETDITLARDIEMAVDLTPIKAVRQELRDATNTLKNLATTGKVNDTVLLDLIRSERDQVL